MTGKQAKCRPELFARTATFKTPEVEIWSGPGPPVAKWRSCLLLNDSIQSLDDNAFLMKNIHLAHNIYFYDDIYLNVKNCKHRFFRFNKTLRIEKKIKGFHWPQDCSFPVPRYSQKKKNAHFSLKSRVFRVIHKNSPCTSVFLLRKSLLPAQIYFLKRLKASVS